MSKRYRPIFLSFSLAIALGLASPIVAQPTGDAAEAAPIAPEGEAPPDHRAMDASAAEVTPANLLESERFWPYAVELTRAWKADGARADVPIGTRGVLIRIEANGKARIDFGRHGLGEVPIDRTDLLARANRVRLGTEPKHLPNFVEAIGPRLLDSSAERVRPVRIHRVFENDAFVAVFADVNEPSFAELAKALAPLATRSRAMTIVFPRGRPLDMVVYERLRALDWKVPFVFQHLAEPYAVTLVDGPPALPWVTVQTAEGRVLFAGKAGAEIATQVTAALDTVPAGRDAAVVNREDSKATP